MSGFWLDFKLGLRMLVRYPLLTIVGGVGLAFGLAAGVAGLEIRTQMINPRLPLDEGDRIVGLRNWDVRRDSLGRSSDADFRAWREQVRTVDVLGAAAPVERNLTVNGEVEPISVAEMTASGFRIARVQPLLGRPLIEADEVSGGPPVAVIGHSLWQRRFRGDPDIVGRSVQLGIEPTTIVGVMPAEFSFPVAHQIWTPLRRQAATASPDTTALLVFGRLASDVTLDQAQAELTTIGQRAALEAPDTHGSLRPEVVPYSRLIFDSRDLDIGLALANIFLNTLLLVVSANVALLMFARAASRESEIGVRSALGASRGRIVAQLFIEAVLLSTLSVIVGMVAARYGLRSLWQLYEAEARRPLAFWFNDSLTPSTIAYAVGLTILGAVIIGVLPALRVTGRQLQARLRQTTVGGYRFGGVWTAVIVTQVAVTVLFPATAFFFHRWVVEGQTRDVGFAAGEYLSARLAAERVSSLEELRRQLTAEPGVTGATFADRLPGMSFPNGRFEVDGDEAPPTYGYLAGMASVDAGFFAALGAPVLSGRAFTPADAASPREVAIVNASFVERVLRGRNAVGRRIRRVAPDRDQAPGPWLDVVGVVRDLGVSGDNEGAGIYRPLTPDSTIHVAVHASGGPSALAGRLRAIAASVDPTLRVYDVMPLNRVGSDQWLESQSMSRVLAVLSGVALLLSLMAIYAVMAFTVVQRTREIGTRVALGGNRWQVVTAIVRRPLLQIAVGIAVGVTLVALLFVGVFDSTPTSFEAAMIAAYAMLMLAVCLSACIVPTRRALRLNPSQVLRAI